MFKYYVYIESEVIVLPLVIYAETRETAYKNAVKQFRRIFKKKITYEEFNDLQRLQKIRDYAQEIFNTLICLGYIAENKHSKKITAMTTEIKAIEDDAVENIRKMLEEE